MTPSSTSPTRPVPPRDPQVLPLLPLVYVAWSDGILDAEEMDKICRRMKEITHLSPETRKIMEGWLDPENPPGGGELAHLRDHIQELAEGVPWEERRSLARLGVAMARSSGGGPEHWGTARGLQTLQGLEQLLGVLGSEAARELLSSRGASSLSDTEGRVPAQRPPPPFDVGRMTRRLELESETIRARVLPLLSAPPLKIPYGLPTPEYREQVLQAVQRLADAGLGRTGLPREWGGEGDIPSSILAFETLAYGDLSVLVKFGVQFGLFGGSILQLGTERHHREYLAKVVSLELPGCYAMTERNHGSNVREVETQARYLAESEEFEIHTPYPGARKDWLGNAALHGRMATVFTQLEVDGEEHGVHAILVPIRDDEGHPLPGIEIEDCGEKVGLHGVDNGRIAFHRVRVPRENLLNRFADVTADGRYISPIPSDGKRFFTMLGTLVTGRISIAAASVSASKTALAIAIRFSDARRQFGPSGQPQVPILDYLTQQRALLPRMAGSYALHFATRQLIRDYSATSSEEERVRVEAMAAGLKAYGSRHAQETIQACREACGGRGYLAENRLGTLRADTDVFTTFEGANVVLLQLVARGLLTRFRDEMGDLRLWGALRFLADRAGAQAARRNPVRSRRTGEDHLLDPETHRAAFLFREDQLIHSVARRLKARVDDGMDSFQATNECQDHLVALARAHVERRILESFLQAVDETTETAIAKELEELAQLWALWRLEEDRAWFLESGYMESTQTQAIRQMVNQGCRRLRDRAVPLVDAFGIPDDILTAPAAFHDPSR